jgi:hypothetical protein
MMRPFAALSAIAVTPPLPAAAKQFAKTAAKDEGQLITPEVFPAPGVFFPGMAPDLCCRRAFWKCSDKERRKPGKDYAAD